ncbi:uncharacterized protein [Lepeophtheirus salmonis]|uniref:uncharacterized protein n=1 Tax=Lepeophtheirus salmonis TaxID=72036 RepID=UPI001AE63C84|nr:uncharacterized protein LOC121116597 [Lepeophtheirus salmonis]
MGEVRDIIVDLQKNNLLSSERVVALTHFQNARLRTVEELVGNRGKSHHYSAMLKDFALTLNFYSPRKDIALIIDGLHLKEALEYDKNLGRVFGFVNYGRQCDLGYREEKANEGLVCMLVGYRAYWKLTIAYFLCKGIQSVVVAGIIRECILRAFEVGITV